MNSHKKEAIVLCVVQQKQGKRWTPRPQYESTLNSLERRRLIKRTKNRGLAVTPSGRAYMTDLAQLQAANWSRKDDAYDRLKLYHGRPFKRFYKSNPLTGQAYTIGFGAIAAGALGIYLIHRNASSGPISANVYAGHGQSSALISVGGILTLTMGVGGSFTSITVVNGAGTLTPTTTYSGIGAEWRGTTPGNATVNYSWTNSDGSVERASSPITIQATPNG